MTWKSTAHVWVLVDVASKTKYTTPGLHFVRRSPDDDFAMFSHVPTSDVLKAMRFNSYKEAARYLDENRHGIFAPDTTFPREIEITAKMKGT